jgi:hypothetical protein
VRTFRVSRPLKLNIYNRLVQFSTDGLWQLSL